MEDRDVLRTPECIECFDSITKHSNSVLKEFETKSELAITNFIGQTTQLFNHLKEESSAYYKDREEKNDAFFEKQEQRYEKLDKRLMDWAKYTLGVVLFIVGIMAPVVGLTYVDVQGKANRDETLSLKDAYTLRTLGDKYYDQRYVLRSGETIDKYTYQWHIETIFENISRGKKIKSIPSGELAIPAPDKLKVEK